MAQLAIKGHPIRGKEVIQLLKMLGGENKYYAQGNCTEVLYFIYDNKGIKYLMESDARTDLMKVFTLEEFEEKYPYKVGDKVKAWINGYCSICNIRDMEWDSIVNEIKYKIQDYWYSTMNLQPYKEENYCQVIGNDTSSNGINTSTSSINEEPEPEPKAPILSNRYDYAEGKCGYVIPDGYEFDYIKEGFQTEIILKPKKPTYPKDYKECCKILNIPFDGNIVYAGHWVYGGKYLEKHLDVLRKFQQLLICRDAYWNIAGKEMGLDKPWKPDFTNIDNCYLAIKTCKGEISLISTLYIEDCILVFPTKEMRDAFFENFKDLINETKELL